MALEHHHNHAMRFQQQVDNSAQYVLPFIHQTQPIIPGLKVLEIGCGEGGVLKPFLDQGCQCTGVDLNQVRIDMSNQFLSNYITTGAAKFLYQNVYDANFKAQYQNHFNLIILKDTIEHIPNQEKFIPYLKELLAPGGQIFFGFPPWCMPHGGHQQITQSKILGAMPYIHLLPNFLYIALLKLCREPKHIIDDLLEVKSTQISIERFEKICQAANLHIKQKTHYLINPIYSFKFGWKVRKQAAFISAIPYLRNFVTTCVYYTVGL